MANQIISLSGGKDSTAMLLMMLERKEPIHSVVFFDTGWEFPEMYDHLDLLEKNTGIKIIRLHPKRSFNHWMFDRKVIPRKGPLKGKVRFRGLGWPRADFRWCTGKKFDEFKKYTNKIKDHTMCIGLVADEQARIKIKTKTQAERNKNSRYPLSEWGISEKEALRYCVDHGYDWHGLYNVFDRVSCFCCPFKRKAELKALYTHYPDLWWKLRQMDENSRTTFKYGKTIKDIERVFAEEDRQMELFAI
jgi:3'-phosphoadenosine 5'-phosphosulfate sulfotransferase (PAPS reductase)/FAD synthetase